MDIVMGTTYRPYAPDQELLLPPSLREWLSEGHLAYFISDVVDELDLSEFHAPYEGDGRHFKRDYGVPEDRAQSNFTDPDSHIMKTGNGFQQCYNGQLAVDGEFQIIVANRLGNNANDKGQLLPILTAVTNALHETPETCLADSGYRKEADFKALEARGIDGYVSLGKEGKEHTDIDPDQYPATYRMAEKLSTPDGKALYARRKHTVEAANGWIKNVLGFRQFSLRGLPAGTLSLQSGSGVSGSR